MTPGVRRLLLRVLKFVVIPVMLLLVGYLFIGPMISDYMNRDTVETPDEEPAMQDEATHEE